MFDSLDLAGSHVISWHSSFHPHTQARWTGKILKVNPDTLAVNIFSSGHRNAWRLFWDAPNNRLLESETGWFTYEEINVIEEGINYGYVPGSGVT